MSVGTQVIAATSTTVIAANSSRTLLVLCNASNEDIFLGFDQAAVQNSGICLPADGGPLVISSKGDLSALLQAAIYGICASGTKNLSYEAR